MTIEEPGNYPHTSVNSDLTDKKFREMLLLIRRELDLPDNDYANELDRILSLEFEKDQFLDWVQEKFGVNRDVFFEKLREHLILKAKPWVKREDIRL